MEATLTPTGAEDVSWDLSDLYAGPEDAALAGEQEEARAAAGAFNAAEATWVVRRVAELQEWPQSAWLADVDTDAAAEETGAETDRPGRP